MLDDNYKTHGAYELKTGDFISRQSLHVSHAVIDSPDTGTIRQRRAAAPPPPPPPQRVDQPAPGSNANGGDDGVVKVRIEGIKIKTKYSTQEVLKITGDAFSKPFTSFITAAGDMGVQLTHDRRLSKDERENMEKIGGALDKLAALAPTNGATQLSGSALNHVNDVIHGKMPTPEEMVEHFHEGTSTFSIEFKVPGAVKLKSDQDKPQTPPVLSRPGAPDSTPSRPGAIVQGTSTIKRMLGEGPINLEPAPDAESDQRRIDEFSPRFSYYRNDSKVSGMHEALWADLSDVDERKGALTVGSGEDATSYVPEANAYLGRGWGPQSGPHPLAGTHIVKLGPGQDGVAAINLRFDDLPPGSTTIVTGGPMRSSTMLFAADHKGFYAYHAGRSTRDWPVAENGARGIVNAHHLMRPGDGLSTPSSDKGNREQLVKAARQYPFSTLVYNGRYVESDKPLVGAKGYVMPGRHIVSDDRLNAPGYATGGDSAHPWQSSVFSYFSAGRRTTIGTAQAVISKDLDGKVTVQVLAEKGRLSLAKPLADGATGCRYDKVDGVTRSYTAEPSTQ